MYVHPFSNAPMSSQTVSLFQNILCLVEICQGKLENEEHCSSLLWGISAGFGVWSSGEQPPPPHQTHGKVAPAGQHEHTGSSLTHRARRVCDHTVGTEYFFFLADRVLIREQALPRPVMGQCV